MGSALSSPLAHTPTITEGSTNNEIEIEVDSASDITEDCETEEYETDRAQRKQKLVEELDEFKDVMNRKRQERKHAIAKITEEMNKLGACQEELDREKLLKDGLEKQVTALKEVQIVSNEMLQLRETQVAGLRQKLQDMESNTENDLTILRNRYEQQIENIQKLRRLYDERADAIARTHRSEMERERARYTLLEIKLTEIENQAEQIVELNGKIKKLEENLSEKDEQIEREKEMRISSESECKNLTAQLTLINNLFSNMLTGCDLDFDLLTQLLQDNHNLITDLIANGDINETAALLFNIAEKVYKQSENITEESEGGDCQLSSTKQEIALNLPKVWRVLIELLGRHDDQQTENNIVQGGSEECYKNIETPYGSRTVISVSQTYLRLKDLILEKNSLVKEVGRLKTLNGHLENRLDVQERRLGVVCSELRKTWGVVSKLKVQHRQLHTHEKILRYELQHKRQMLTDLKNELKYCRETWDRAREKNTQTEHDWEELRKEFSSRKNRDNSNSAESGYDDDEISQSPDTSASDSEYDISDSQASVESELEAAEGRASSIDCEDGASDATVIELIDMLDFDAENFEETIPDPSSFHGIEDNINGTNFIIDNEVPDNTEEFPNLKTDSTGAAGPSTDEKSASSEEDIGGPDLDDIQCPTSTIIQKNLSEKAPSTTSTEPTISESTNPRNTDEMLNLRAERLRRLEIQCRSLLNQMTLTSLKSDTLSTRLEELHEQYGSQDGNSRRSSEATEPPVASNNFGNGDMSEPSHSERNVKSAPNNDFGVDSEDSVDTDGRTRERVERLLRMEEECMEFFEASGSTTNDVVIVPNDLPPILESNSPERQTEFSDCECPDNSQDCPINNSSPELGVTEMDCMSNSKIPRSSSNK